MNNLNENAQARNEHNIKAAKALHGLAADYNSNTVNHGDTIDHKAQAAAKAASKSATIRLAAAFDLKDHSHTNQAGA